ncbi:xyloglucan endotransglucosylase protein 6 isoform X2 [Aegilops tauschii subsp. strangulata]|uniref:Xyloglucan endotransglucosylase/hydrolase n=2 Tax=Triticinae TaxID=1648030 RepID=A0A453D2Z6_AEGTS|nr:xyloglucan endotransglucosylase/hydrolase protein 9 isoform X2 [Aegilops tauschii subsp. strangulata]XP_044334515.1 xyloglucan endotransglucosylase/hydrolase protein 9-like isoform X2 [Triticum aestivum]
MAWWKNGALVAAASLAVAAVVCAGVAAAASKFDDVVQPSWANDHVLYEDDLLKLRLDSSSGGGFASKNRFLYGKATADLKLVPGDSAGVVTAFYLSSAGEKHNEFDFEFLGNVTGEPYLVQTNLYIDGVGNREQRIDLWFDPTADFHTYAVLWNPSQVVFLVDDTPIRVYDNKNASATKPKGHHRHPNATTTQAQTASAFPSPQPMAVYSSIWNADDWATRGGLVKTDWSHAPFVATFRDVRVEGCAWAANASDSDAGEVARCSGSSWGKEGRYWWKEKDMQELSVHQSHQLVWARAHHLVYDYCVDTDRFPVQPPECAGR